MLVAYSPPRCARSVITKLGDISKIFYANQCRFDDASFFFAAATETTKSMAMKKTAHSNAMQMLCCRLVSTHKVLACLGKSIHILISLDQCGCWRLRGVKKKRVARHTNDCDGRLYAQDRPASQRAMHQNNCQLRMETHRNDTAFSFFSRISTTTTAFTCLFSLNSSGCLARLLFTSAKCDPFRSLFAEAIALKCTTTCFGILWLTLNNNTLDDYYER